MAGVPYNSTPGLVGLLQSGDWKRGNLLPIETNQATGQRRLAVPGSLVDLLQGAMAPGKAWSGGYGLAIDPQTGVNYYPGMAGDATSLAGLLATGAAPIPKPTNALGMFGGVMAKTADKEALARAEQMAAAGASRDDIWNATGWFKGKDDKWRFEIDDSAAGYRPPDIRRFEQLGMGESMRNNATLLRHPDLANAYDLSAIDTEITKGGGYPYRPEARHQVRQSGKEEIYINANTLDQAKPLNLHELQHALQMKEGFSGGADALNVSLAPYRDELMATALAEHRQLGTPLGNALAKAEAEKRWQIYMATAGEVEARNVESRMNMTAAERRAKAPWYTQDVPDEQQIVRFK